MTTAGGHLFAPRAGGRRVHLAACWCWRPPLEHSVTGDGTRAQSYPELVAERLAAAGSLRGPITPGDARVPTPLLVDVALRWRRWRSR